MRTKRNRKTFFVTLENEVFNHIRLKVLENNKKRTKGKYKLKLDIACFYLDYVIHAQSILDNVDEYGYVKLCSKYMKKYCYKYNVYLEFLENEEFIKVNPRYITDEECMSYKYIKPTNSSKRILYEYNDYTFKKRLRQKESALEKEAKKTVSHLTKWFEEEGLEIIDKEAVEYIETLKDKSFKKYIRRYVVDTIKHRIFYCRRNGKDNRLHTVLSRLPKDLRKFLRYKGQSLVSMDIKSSQPYMLAGLLNVLLIKRESAVVEACLKSIEDKSRRKSIGEVITVMWKKNLSDLDIVEIERFIKLVTEGDVYLYIGDHFSKSFLYEIQTPMGISDKFFDDGLGYKKTVEFDTLRDYSKRAMLEFLYSSPNSKEKRNKELRRILPDVVVELIAQLKQGFKEDFPIFLQNLEAHLVLDRITKRIAQERPEAPLYTIHDSVATTEEHSDFVRDALKEGLTDFFGISPKIETEYWLNNNSEAA